MKYIVLLVDGMADYPIESLGNKTPLEVVNIPNINSCARRGEVGMVQTIPPGMSPGSDTANLSVMGYAPEIYHTGRSPLEAASMGVEMKDTDITFRCNLVTVSEEADYASKTMIDHSSGEITTEEARELILFLKPHLENTFLKLYPGVSYRHLLVWDQGPEDFTLTPPHDILEQPITTYLPQGSGAAVIREFIEKSYQLLKDHPVNLARIEKGLRPANSAWIWGEGKKPRLDSFKEKFGIDGAVISAVDLINGIGVCAGLEPIVIPGATGTIHTNFEGKAKGAVDVLKAGKDFVYVHLEAPDECGHQGDLAGKMASMEIIDEKVAGYILREMDAWGVPYRFLVLPDHRTPIVRRTHTTEPVPYVLYDSTAEGVEKNQYFSESSGEASGNYFASGHELMDYFVKQK